MLHFVLSELIKGTDKHAGISQLAEMLQDTRCQFDEASLIALTCCELLGLELVEELSAAVDGEETEDALATVKFVD